MKRGFVRVALATLLAGLLHAVTTAPASAAVPHGVVDMFVSDEPGRVRAAGWVFDPDEPGAWVAVHVYVGGHGVNIGEARAYRPDVGRAYPGAGDYHGYDAVIDIPLVGEHTWEVYGIDTRGGPPALLGSGRVTIADPNPFGSFDAVSSPGHRQVAVSGWACDPNNRAATLNVEVYIGGPAGAAGAERHLINTSVERADVTATYGCSPRPGFLRTLTTAKTGRQAVHIYALNHPGSPGGTTYLGSRVVDIYVDTTPPQTTITSAPRYATPTDAIRVEFSASEPNATFQCRWDEGAWTPCQGSTTVTLAPGNHLVSVRASDVYGNVDPTPATWVVTVSAPGTQPPPAPGPAPEPDIALRAVKRSSKLRIDVDPDSDQTNYRVVVQRRSGTKWRKVDAVRTRGSADRAVVDLRRGTYRVKLPASAGDQAVVSRPVRLKR